MKPDMLLERRENQREKLKTSENILHHIKSQQTLCGFNVLLWFAGRRKSYGYG